MTKNEIQKILLDIGIPANLLGFSYITSALQLLMQDNTISTKSVYIEIAREFRTSMTNVERCIRHAINVGWSYGITPAIETIFRQSVDPRKGVPTNTQFLSSVLLFITDA